MTETYKIIQDEKLLKEFIEWLPDLEEHEKFYYCCFSRKKYSKNAPNSSTDKNQLKRGLSDKNRLYEKLWQLEVPIGAYINRTTKEPVEQNSLAVYLTPNPRDCYKSTLNGIIGLTNAIKNNHTRFNPYQEVLSEVHRTPSKKHFIIFDIDLNENDIVNINDAIKMVDGHCDVIKTRGGYHVCVHKSKIHCITNKFWYQELQKISDQIGDLMVPVVGCCQGGFVPYFYYKDYKFYEN